MYGDTYTTHAEGRNMKVQSKEIQANIKNARLIGPPSGSTGA
jgi:hypothetical protein